MKCSECKESYCDKKIVKNCASAYTNQQNILDEYLLVSNLEFAKNASLVSMSLNGKKTRIEELIEFAHLMDYKRLGLCFCVGLKN